MKRGVKQSVRQRIDANRKRAQQVQERDEREREAIRILIQQVQPDKDDIVGQCAASIIRVQRID